MNHITKIILKNNISKSEEENMNIREEHYVFMTDKAKQKRDLDPENDHGKVYSNAEFYLYVIVIMEKKL